MSGSLTPRRLVMIRGAFPKSSRSQSSNLGESTAALSAFDTVQMQCKAWPSSFFAKEVLIKFEGIGSFKVHIAFKIRKTSVEERITNNTE